jgi:hypothetical protein
MRKIITFLKRLFFGKTIAEKTHKERYEEYLSKREALYKEYGWYEPIDDPKQLTLFDDKGNLKQYYSVKLEGEPVKEFWKKREAELQTRAAEHKAKVFALDKEYGATIAEQKARQEAIEKEDNYKVIL